jgi:hypothetical protein
MGWYIVKKGKAAGPFKESEIRSWLKSGKLSVDTYATREGLDEWRPIAEQLKLIRKSAESMPEEMVTEPEERAAEEAEKSEDKDPDLRRYQPQKEERFRSMAWGAVGLLYFLVFLWPTHMVDGIGVVNLELSWANENISWSAIPLMLWPALAGLSVGTLGFMTRGRVRGILALVFCFAPLGLVLLVGGDGLSKIMGSLNALPGLDLTDLDSATESIAESAEVLAEKGPGFLGGVLGVFAAMALGMVIMVGVFLSVYFTVLVTPHVVRHFRPNSKGAYYFALIGGVVLFLLLLVFILLALFSFAGGILYGLGFVISLVMQLVAVVLGFMNSPSRPPEQSTRRALWSVGMSMGGVFLFLGTLLVVPLIGGGLEAQIGLYLFKALLGFVAAALILPLATIDLWLGRAASVPQND